MSHIRLRLPVFWLLLVIVVAGGTLAFMAVEHFSLVDAFYFTIITIATVGYGDLHPVTPAGKLLAVALIVAGVGTFLGVISHVTELMVSRREQQASLERLNLVIGVFFTALGAQLIALLETADPGVGRIRDRLLVSGRWTRQDFDVAAAEIRGYDYQIEVHRLDLAALKAILTTHRDLLVALLQNPSLPEHEAFTDLLQAVFHLAEELGYRQDLSQLPPSDLAHLAGDAQRVYRILVGQWLQYVRGLQASYPYLFSLAMRTNPFQPRASAIVE